MEPPPRNKKMVYRIALFICRQTISMKNLNGKQNHRPGKDREGHLQLPHEILLNDPYSLHGVYWIISCISLVPLCFLLVDTSKWVMRRSSAVDNIIWPQCMTGRGWYPKSAKPFWEKFIFQHKTTKSGYLIQNQV